MSEEKKNTPEKQKESKPQKEKKKNKMDKELKQSFPASDPPSRSRPGHERTESEQDKS